MNFSNWLKLNENNGLKDVAFSLNAIDNIVSQLEGIFKKLISLSGLGIIDYMKNQGNWSVLRNDPDLRSNLHHRIEDMANSGKIDQQIKAALNNMLQSLGGIQQRPMAAVESCLIQVDNLESGLSYILNEGEGGSNLIAQGFELLKQLRSHLQVIGSFSNLIPDVDLLTKNIRKEIRPLHRKIGPLRRQIHQDTRRALRYEKLNHGDAKYHVQRVFDAIFNPVQDMDDAYVNKNKQLWIKVFPCQPGFNCQPLPKIDPRKKESWEHAFRKIEKGDYSIRWRLELNGAGQRKGTVMIWNINDSESTNEAIEWINNNAEWMNIFYDDQRRKQQRRQRLGG